MADETKEAGNGQGPSPEIISRAKELGWSPKEEWRGNPEQWIDADAFVERGETLMPLLKANNRKLTSELHATRAQLSEAQRIIQANTEAIEELKKFNTTTLRQQATTQKKEIAKAIAEARREGNVEEELELTERLTETTRVLKETENQPRVTKPKGTAPATATEEQSEDMTAHPDFQAFAKENPWLGSDKRKTNLATAIAQELREDPKWKGVYGKAFLDAVAAEVNATLGETPRGHTSRVEGGAGNGSAGSGSGGRGKGYESLPAEAKAACERQASRLVGEGRAYKTIADWRKAYATKYFEE